MTAVIADIERYDFVDTTSALRPPRTLGDGSRVFEVVVAAPGVQRYDHGDEYVPASTLEDETYRASLVGIPVLAMEGRHPPKFVYRMDTRGAKAIGRIISQRWDAAVGNICEVVVPDPADEQLIRTKFRFVSLGYRVDVGGSGVTPDGRPYQSRQDRRYDVNHLVVTHNPRVGPAAQFRTDNQENSMTPEEIAAAFKVALAPILADIVAIKERQDSALKAPEREDTAGDWQAVLAVADAAGVEVKVGDTLADASKRVADAIMPDRGDAVSAMSAISATHKVLSAKPGDKPSVWQKISEGSRNDTSGGAGKGFGGAFNSASGRKE